MTMIKFDAKDQLRLQIEAWCQQQQIAAPVPEYRFHPERKWRFDYAWPEQKLAIEYEGGTWVPLDVLGRQKGKSRHITGIGFRNDCEKYNQASLLGWHVLRFTVDMVRQEAHLVCLQQFFFPEA